MKNEVLLVVVMILLTACVENTSENKQKDSPDLLGWTVKNIVELKSQCKERYRHENKEERKENYCNCLAEKIIFSVPYEKHNSPDEETVALYEEFSKTCEELTRE